MLTQLLTMTATTKFPSLEAVVEGPPEAGGRGEGVHLAEHRHRLLQPGVDVLQSGADFLSFVAFTNGNLYFLVSYKFR